MNTGNDLINDAECGVIGGLLLFTQEAVPQLEGLSTGDFSREPYGVIFQTALQTVRSNPGADGAVILSRLQSHSKELAATAMRCMELFLSMANFSSYVRIVRHESRKRRVRSRLEAVLLSGSDDPCTELEAIVEEFREQGKSGMTQAAGGVKFINSSQQSFLSVPALASCLTLSGFKCSPVVPLTMVVL